MAERERFISQFQKPFQKKLTAFSTKASPFDLIMTSSHHEIVQALLNKGFLASPDLLQDDDLNKDSLLQLFNTSPTTYDALAVITKDVYAVLTQASQKDVNWLELDGTRVIYEKNNNLKPYQTFLDTLLPPLPRTDVQVTSAPQPIHPSEPLLELSPPPSLSVLRMHQEPSKKRTTKDFVTYYKHRYHFLSELLKNRSELKHLISINRVKHRPSNEEISLIGVVFEKNITKNGHIILTLEDPTGHIKVFLNKNGPLKELIPYLTYDEVIGVKGYLKNDLFFANALLFPDIPLDHQSVKSDQDAYAVFISDVHIGSRMFLEQEFVRFIDWLNGNVGTDAQRDLAKKVKYLFIVGDVVDGVGIYPNQFHELTIKDVYQQYNKAKELLSTIRKDVSIVMCPGNHDAVRIAEPQPSGNGFNNVLLQLGNLTLVSNPSYITLRPTPSSQPITVLMYHGYSYDYYAANIEPIRTGGAYNRTDLIMKYLLQKRHLAPSHTSTLYLPCEERDPLLIDIIPDIFVSGHVHKSAVNTYHGVLLISNSCWQSKTSFQEKLGHEPDPGRVPLVNLRTHDVTILNFCDENIS